MSDELNQSGGELVPTKGASLPAAYDFGDDAGAGMTEVSAKEQRVSFIGVAQSNSPQIDNTSAKYIPGCKAGDFFNVATGEFWDGKVGLEIIPAWRSHDWVEFTPRNLGGGFLGSYKESDPAVQTLIKKRLDDLKRQGKPARILGKLSTTTRWDQDQMPLDGTEFTEIFTLACGFVPPPFDRRVTPFPGLFGFKSTQIVKYQTFVTRYLRFAYDIGGKLVSPPIWAHRWKLTTVGEQKKKGKYFGVVLRLAEVDANGAEKYEGFSLLRKDDPWYQFGKELNHQMTTGQSTADMAQASDADTSDQRTAHGNGDAGGPDDDDIPM